MSEPRAHYNTTGMNRAEVAEVSQKNNAQDDAVMKLFSIYPKAKFSASRVLSGCIHHELLHKDTLQSSIRRSLSNLSHIAVRKLVKLPERKMGPNGRTEHLFALPSNQSIQ